MSSDAAYPLNSGSDNFGGPGLLCGAVYPVEMNNPLATCVKPWGHDGKCAAPLGYHEDTDEYEWAEWTVREAVDFINQAAAEGKP